MNNNILARLTGIQQQLIAHHKGGHGLPSATIGNEREILIREFLSKVFPNSFRFGTGCITDSNNNLSGQVDVVIEMPFGPSFPMPAGIDRLYLAESVGAIVEVKSNLSAQWGQVTSTVRQVRPLERKITSYMSFGGPSIKKIPIYAIGYVGYSSIESLVKKMSETEPDEKPDAALVIEGGFYYGLGLEATGPLALYALIASLNKTLCNLQAANFDLLNYCT
jgi:hypothetical protein